jgi:hypothetical protein
MMEDEQQMFTPLEVESRTPVGAADTDQDSVAMRSSGPSRDLRVSVHR